MFYLLTGAVLFGIVCFCIGFKLGGNEADKWYQEEYECIPKEEA